MSSLLVLSARDVRQALPYRECIEVMRGVLAAYSRGEAHQPLRMVVQPPGAAGLMAVMPAYLPPAPPGGPAGGPAGGGDPGEPAYGLKAICISPGNPGQGLDAHQGGVLISAAGTGEPLALLNASALTEIRTAAVSAVATTLLAQPDASVLAVIGTGVQARAHIQAIEASRTLSQIRVAGRAPGRGEEFAVQMAPLTQAPVLGCATPGEALAGAGIVVTATSAAAPVLRRGWLAAGAHVNAVGACLPEVREIDAETMADAALFVDSRESATSEAGDVLLAVADGAIGIGHIRAELGEVITGAAPGRRNAQEITVFESLGLAVEDLAAAAYAYRRAGELGLGTLAEF